MKINPFTAADLQQGKEYEVVREFADYDGMIHRIGDRWVFKEKNFVPYDDGLTVFVEAEGQVKQIRLQWRQEQQLGIIEAFSEYVVITTNCIPDSGGNA